VTFSGWYEIPSEGEGCLLGYSARLRLVACGFVISRMTAAAKLPYCGSGLDGCVQCLYVRPQSMADVKACSSQVRSP